MLVVNSPSKSQDAEKVGAERRVTPKRDVTGQRTELFLRPQLFAIFGNRSGDKVQRFDVRAYCA